MAEWLKARRVESVAMESTGVYWIAPHEVLEAQALAVLLVDTRRLAGAGARQEDRPDGLRVDSATTQLRIAAGFVSTGGSGLYVADAGAG
jgi:transposase